MKTLEALVPGDRVAVLSKRIGRSAENRLLEVATIERVTATQIHVRRRKYYRATGLELGHGGSHIIPASEEHERIWKTNQEANALVLRERQALEQRKEDLRARFPKDFFPTVSVFGGDKIELIFDTTWEQAEAIAKLLKR